MIEKQRLENLRNSFTNKNIAVIGDLMLDGYFWGDVTRISPEAPVPVIEVDKEFYKFGGAANVALNIQTLGGNPIPIGIIGDDSDGVNFKNILTETGINSDGIITDQNRPTTVKTRVIAGKNHIVRIDKESKKNISEEIEKNILDFLTSKIDEIDALILQDYNKGVFTKSLIKNIIELGLAKNKIITVDPKFLNFKEYKKVTLFKPNKKETEDILGFQIKSDEEISRAGKILLEMINSKYIMLTLGENGIALFEKDKEEIRIPTKARKVSDVSGAGDTVISTITFALANNTSIEEAAYLANYAAGIVCEEVGIVPIEKDKLFDTIRKNQND